MAMNDCRFFEQEFPEVETLVVVQVKRLTDMGSYVALLEYNNHEGMLLHTELSKRRIRSINKHVRVGQTMVCLVLRVDEDKGYIDLSKRRATPEDAAIKEESFAKAKAVHGIMRHVASQQSIPVEQICEKVAWPLQRKHPDLHDAFVRHVRGEINIWEDLDDISDKSKELIEVDLRRKLTMSALRLRAKVEVSCFGYEGIDAVRNALLAGLEASKEDAEVKIKLIAHPVFALVCTCKDKELGFSTLNESIRLIEESIKAQKEGEFAVKQRPDIMGANDKEEDNSSESGSDSGSEEQDETMGAANFDEEELKKNAKVEDDDDDKKGGDSD